MLRKVWDWPSPAGSVCEGALVFLGDLKEDQGRAAAAELTSQGAQAWFVRLDVTDEESWKAALTALIDKAGKLDVLVNNAGINIRQPIEEMSVESLDMMLAVNVRGPFLGIKHALPLMRRNGGGSIISMGSVCSLIGHKFTPEAYTLTKGAISQLTRAVAVRYAKDNIRANVLCPSTVETPLVQEMLKRPRAPAGARGRGAPGPSCQYGGCGRRRALPGFG